MGRNREGEAPALHEAHCGILPLGNRFIVVDWEGTRWVIPAKVALELACEYYEDTGWYDESEIEEDGLEQLHGKELRDCIEVNGDLEQAIREARWRRVERRAIKVGGGKGPNDQGWWFEENGGTIKEMTDLSLEEQEPMALFWFDEEYRLSREALRGLPALKGVK